MNKDVENHGKSWGTACKLTAMNTDWLEHGHWGAGEVGM